MQLVRIKDLVFKYPSSGGRFVLSVPDFNVAAGESVALLGESGSGKSTLLKIMAMLESGYTGSVDLFNGASKSVVIRKMAFLFQDAPVFYGDVFENVAIGLRIRGENKADIDRKVKNALEILNISELARCDSREISGGQARRVCMARAIALEPEILFLDEPFYSVDNITKHEIMHDFKKYLAHSRCAMVLVTHDKNEALSLCGRITVMKNGSILQDAPAAECFYHPVCEDVARLIGRHAIFYGAVAESGGGVCLVICGRGNDPGTLNFEVAGGYAPGEKLCLMISPEDISLDIKGEGLEKTSVLNHFSGSVRSVSHFEFGMLVTVSIGEGFEMSSYITMRSYSALGLAHGSPVRLSIKATAIKTVEIA